MKALLRLIATATAAGAVALTTLSATGNAVAAPPAPPSAVVAPAAGSAALSSEWCSRTLERIEFFRKTSSFTLPGTLRLLGKPSSTPVDLATMTLRDVPYATYDASIWLWYRSMLWLAVAAAEKHEAGDDASAKTMADAMIRAITAYPDPAAGPNATPGQVAWANAFGWDEGTTFRRAEALLCLSSVTGAAPVRQLLIDHGNALMDPKRYMGPPLREVHNHGLLANLVLIDIARRLIDVPGAKIQAQRFRAKALQRLAADAPYVFSPGGWSYEGSTHYLWVNIKAWNEAAAVLRLRGYAPTAAAIERRLAAARDMAAHLVGPAGQFATIGNSYLKDPDAMRPPIVPTRNPLKVDPTAGVAVGRWSWTDPETSWYTAVNTGRSGGHSHDDDTSLTWFTRGQQVLQDPGQFNNTYTHPITKWMRRAVAHNRALPVPISPDTQNVRTLSVTRSGGLDTIRMTSSDKGPIVTREALVDDSRKTLQVTDSVTSGRVTQRWHLASGWSLTSSDDQRTVFTGPRGRILTVSPSPGTRIIVMAPALNPPTGLIASTFGQLISAPEFTVSGDSSASTLFQVTVGPPAKVPPTPAVTVTPASGRAVATWALPTGTTKKQQRAVTGYRVQVRDPVTGWRTVKAATRSAARTTVKLRGLTNGERYAVRVAALTRTGIGAYSEPALVTPVGPPAAPTDPVASGTTLSWTAPVVDNGAAVRRYVVTVGSQELRPVRGTSIDLADSLAPGRVVIRVVAQNKAGDSPALRVTGTVTAGGRLTLS